MVKPTKIMKAMLAKAPGKTIMPLADAIKILKDFPARKFDQSVEIHMHLGIDPAQADQLVRGSAAKMRASMSLGSRRMIGLNAILLRMSRPMSMPGATSISSSPAAASLKTQRSVT